MRKTIVLTAIGTLKDNYRLGIHNAGITGCPLCQAFHNDELETRDDNPCCTICPNMAFKSRQEKSCVKRGDLIGSLNYHWDFNYPTLAKYWQQIYELYVQTSDEEILTLSEDLQKRILEIAATFK